MKKTLLFLALSVALFSFGCKKDNAAGDNASSEADNITKTDMTKFEKSLSIFQNPQYDFLYKLIEKGIDAKTEEDVTIPYPNHAKHNSYNSGDNVTILKGATPLGIAALFCTPSLVNDLIENGADLKATINNSQISAMIIQCGEAEQAGMFEKYLSKTRKFEQNNPDTYKNKPALYASNAIIATDDKGNGQTILNYAIEHKLNDAIPVIVKYAGWINYTNEKDPNNNKYPIITAIDSENYEALTTFLKGNGSLHTQFETNDGVKISILDYIFYKGIGDKLANNVPADVLLTAIINGYAPKSTGIPEIKELIKGGDILAKTTAPLTLKTKKGNAIEIPVGSNIAHIAAHLGYSVLVKGISILPDGVKTFEALDSNNERPLHIAVKGGKFAVSKLLLESGSPVAFNDVKDTPFTLLNSLNGVSNQASLTKLLLTSPNTGFAAQFNIGNFNINDETTYNKAMASTIKKYAANPNHNAYLNKAYQIVLEQNIPALTRLIHGGIDNTLAFEMNIGENTFSQGTTPLIIATSLCNAELVNALILAGADTDVRVTGENDLKFNAYDFADRVYNCDSSVKSILKDPKTAVASEQVVSDFNLSESNTTIMMNEEGQAAAANMQTTATVEETIDNATTSDNATVENTDNTTAEEVSPAEETSEESEEVMNDNPEETEESEEPAE